MKKVLTKFLIIKKPLRDARPAGRDVDSVGREPLGGELEGAAGAGGVLEEEVHHGAVLQVGQFLDPGLLQLVHPPGQVKDRVDLVGAKISDAEQMLHGRAPPGFGSVAAAFLDPQVSFGLVEPLAQQAPHLVCGFTLREIAAEPPDHLGGCQGFGEQPPEHRPDGRVDYEIGRASCRERV